MTSLTSESVLAILVIFCRIGGSLLVAPGFSSSQIPARIRLFVGFAITLALAPILIDSVKARLGPDAAPATILPLIFAELATGFLIGFLARLFFAALQTITVAISQAIGLGALPGTVMEESEQMPAITTLFAVTATVILFASDLHLEMVKGLLESYATIPPGTGFVSRLALADVTDQLTSVFLVALRIGSPFLVYSLIVNFAVGLTNKLTPQIPVYFIAVPFVLAGGLLLTFYAMREFVSSFIAAFSFFLLKG